MKTDPRFAKLEEKLIAFQGRTNYEDIRQDAYCAFLSGKSEDDAVDYAVHKDNSFWLGRRLKAKSLYNEKGDCLDEDFYFRTDREDGELGYYIGDKEKDMVKKIHEGCEMIRCIYLWAERPERKHPYSDYNILKSFMRRSLGANYNIIGQAGLGRVMSSAGYIKSGKERR